MEELREIVEDYTGRINKMLKVEDISKFLANLKIASEINAQLKGIMDTYSLFNDENLHAYQKKLLNEKGYNNLVNVGKEIIESFKISNDEEGEIYANAYIKVMDEGLSIYGEDKLEEFVELTDAEDVVEIKEVE